jgi:hypothetical protein
MDVFWRHVKLNKHFLYVHVLTGFKCFCWPNRNPKKVLILLSYEFAHYLGAVPAEDTGYFGEDVYRTSGVIFFIDYCTALRDT